MKLPAEIMKSLDLEHLSGILIREEYLKALKAMVEYAEIEHLQNRTDDNEDDLEEVGRSETGPLGTRLANLFLNLLPDFKLSRRGFILLGHPGIGEGRNLLSKSLK